MQQSTSEVVTPPKPVSWCESILSVPHISPPPARAPSPFTVRPASRGGRRQGRRKPASSQALFLFIEQITGRSNPRLTKSNDSSAAAQNIEVLRTASRLPRFLNAQGMEPRPTWLLSPIGPSQFLPPKESTTSESATPLHHPRDSPPPQTPAGITAAAAESALRAGLAAARAAESQAHAAATLSLASKTQVTAAGAAAAAAGAVAAVGNRRSPNDYSRNPGRNQPAGAEVAATAAAAAAVTSRAAQAKVAEGLAQAARAQEAATEAAAAAAVASATARNLAATALSVGWGDESSINGPSRGGTQQQGVSSGQFEQLDCRNGKQNDGKNGIWGV